MTATPERPGAVAIAAIVSEAEYDAIMLFRVTEEAPHFVRRFACSEAIAAIIGAQCT